MKDALPSRCVPRGQGCRIGVDLGRRIRCGCRQVLLYAIRVLRLETPSLRVGLSDRDERTAGTDVEEDGNSVQDKRCGACPSVPKTNVICTNMPLAW